MSRIAVVLLVIFVCDNGPLNAWRNPACGLSYELADFTYEQSSQRGLKGFEKGSMVGFISNLAPLLNHLRRRSPGAPVPARPPSGRGTGGYK
eukprot:scaffold2410_cov36-Phaeocystis_antarctica.AAC.1